MKFLTLAFALLTASVASATYPAVTVFRSFAPTINYGHVVQTYSFGYAPPTVLYALPPTVTYQAPPVFSAPAPQCPVQAAVQADPPVVPACPATQQLFSAAPAATYGYAGSYANVAGFAAPFYTGAVSTINYQAFRSAHAAAFGVPVRSFNTFNSVNVRTPFVNVTGIRAPSANVNVASVREPGVNVNVASVNRSPRAANINVVSAAAPRGSTTVIQQQQRTGLLGLRNQNTTTVISR